MTKRKFKEHADAFGNLKDQIRRPKKNVSNNLVYGSKKKIWHDKKYLLKGDLTENFNGKLKDGE